MAIFTKTPLRISFFGGGTDYPEYYFRKKGAVLGLSINKYIYIAAIEMSGIQDYKYRLSYSNLEFANHSNEIRHPVVRALLKEYGIESALDISILSDMPANSGLGSSSSFTVGLVNLLKSYKHVAATKYDLAMEAIRIEKEVLKENVGIQDQLHAAFGGLNRFDFDKNGISIKPIAMTLDSLNVLNNSMFLVYTGQKRYASSVVSSQVGNTRDGVLDRQLERMFDMVAEGEWVIRNVKPEDLVGRLGELLVESWKEKKGLGKGVSNEDIDRLCKICIECGARGIKLCGAGSGGFILCLVDEESQGSFKKRLMPHKAIKIDMDTVGTTLLYK